MKRAPLRPDRRLLSIVVPLDLYLKTVQLANRQNKPIANVVREALAQYIEAQTGATVPYTVGRGGWNPPRDEMASRKRER